MPPPTLPDVLGDVRTWLRGLTALSATTGPRWFFRIPDKPTYPLGRIYRAGGAMQPGETPVRDIRLALEIFGGRMADYAAVTTTATALEAALHALAGPIGAGTYVLNAQVTAVIDNPDPDTGWPGQLMDVVFTVR